MDKFNLGNMDSHVPMPPPPHENPAAPEPRLHGPLMPGGQVHKNPYAPESLVKKDDMLSGGLPAAPKGKPVEGVFYDKHGKKVDHLTEKQLAENIAHDIKKEKYPLRSKLGFKNTSDWAPKKFGREAASRFHGKQINEWKVKKELGEANQKLDRDRGLGEAQFKERSKSDAINEDKEHIGLLGWLLRHKK